MCMTHGQNERLPVLWSVRHCHILDRACCVSKYCLSMRMPLSVRALLQILFAPPATANLWQTLCHAAGVFVCMKAVIRQSPCPNSRTVEDCVGFTLPRLPHRSTGTLLGQKGKRAHTVTHSLRRQQFSVSCTPLPKECMLPLLFLTGHRQTWSTLY